MSCDSPITGSIFLRIFIFSLGFMMVLPAAYKLFSYCGYRYWGDTAYGVIDHPSSGRDVGGRPLIQYTDAAGAVHEFKSRAKTHWFYSPTKGERLKIFIHRDDPRKAIVDDVFHYVILPFLFLTAGCYCCLSAILGRGGTLRQGKAFSL